MIMSKKRLDITLEERGLAVSCENAKALIMAGEVFVNGQLCLKSDNRVSEFDEMEIKTHRQYVSRGAYKLERALWDFNIDPGGLKALVIGISNGGLSYLLLKKGAAEILGIDVNIAQVDYKLVTDSRVKLLKLNARYIEDKHLKFLPDLIVIDVSFISILKILKTLRFLKNVPIISLVKPQFEADKREVLRGGIINSVEKRREIVLRIKKQVEKNGYALKGFTLAGIKGKKGNQEYFFLLEHGKEGSISDKIVEDEIKI